ncbi:MAG: hypothetical protein EAZ13_08920 [Sphingobacteriia bacterium]|nr:MAG: hypothetical protein EAZ41_09255 [Sphingobacteriia bacterium]TAG30153.1 MAG: hypothetical protein EAZ35_08205 [Sphingobacteriia bacterium]TAH06598.1 MAG: hypothetical protein EAZ13_08920 [Sphingobacteriia bacterium]
MYKILELTIPTEIQEFKKEGIEWTISQISTTYQININKSTVLSKNKVPHSILFSVKNNTAKEFILCSKKNGNWIAHFITFKNVDVGGTLLEVRNLKRILIGIHPLLNGSNSLKNNRIFHSAEENKIRSMSLPPVSVTGYRRNTSSTYISMFWAHGGNAEFGDDFFGEVETFHQDEAGGGGEIEVIEIEADDSENKDSINLKKIIDCFGTIPDAGATYTVKIHADIPINSNPEWLFDLYRRSPGHVFLRLTKIGTNGQEMTQSIGFYPETGYKSVIYPFNSVSSKIVNDGEGGNEHEYNAAFAASATKEQFEAVLNRLTSTSVNGYSLVNYNCAHYAIAAFNEVMPNFSSIPITVPFGTSLIHLTASPLGVYETLKMYNNANIPNTEFNVLKKARTSHGPCN